MTALAFKTELLERGMCLRGVAEPPWESVWGAKKPGSFLGQCAKEVSSPKPTLDEPYTPPPNPLDRTRMSRFSAPRRVRPPRGVAVPRWQLAEGGGG